MPAALAALAALEEQGLKVTATSASRPTRGRGRADDGSRARRPRSPRHRAGDLPAARRERRQRRGAHHEPQERAHVGRDAVRGARPRPRPRDHGSSRPCAPASSGSRAICSSRSGWSRAAGLVPRPAARRRRPPRRGSGRRCPPAWSTACPASWPRCSWRGSRRPRCRSGPSPSGIRPVGRGPAEQRPAPELADRLSVEHEAAAALARAGHVPVPRHHRRHLRVVVHAHRLDSLRARSPCRSAARPPPSRSPRSLRASCAPPCASLLQARSSKLCPCSRTTDPANIINPVTTFHISAITPFSKQRIQFSDISSQPFIGPTLRILSDRSRSRKRSARINHAHALET